jgi:HEAT repeat protein
MGLTRRTPEETSSERRFRDRGREGLLEQLGETDPVARRWAAHDLADYPDAASAMLARLSEEPEKTVQSAILNSLTRQASLEVVRGLIRFLRCEDAWLKGAVIEALGLLPRELAAVVEELLADPTSDVRIHAISVLGSLADPRVPGWLLRAAREDEHPNVVAAALEGLCECGTEEMLPDLLHLQHRFREVPFVVFAADVAIGRIRRAPP